MLCTIYTCDLDRKPSQSKQRSHDQSLSPLNVVLYGAVYADGGICLDILQNKWTASYDVTAVLASIQSLLPDPNPNSPANAEAAKLYVENRREYNRRVKETVEATWVHENDVDPDRLNDDEDDDEDR